MSSTAGTPAFTAPEALAERAGFSGKAADIWSIGITLFSFVYGKIPFHDENIVSLHSRIRHQSVQFPPMPAVSEKLKNLIRRMLIKDPAMRITLSEIKVRSFRVNLTYYSSIAHCECIKKAIIILKSAIGKV